MAGSLHLHLLRSHSNFHLTQTYGNLCMSDLIFFKVLFGDSFEETTWLLEESVVNVDHCTGRENPKQAGEIAMINRRLNLIYPPFRQDRVRRQDVHGGVDEHRGQVPQEGLAQREEAVPVPVPQSPEDVPRGHRNMCQRFGRVLADSVREQQHRDRHRRANSIRVLAVKRPDHLSVERTSLR